jgi:hypothetical protein
MPWFPDFAGAVELARKERVPRARPIRSGSTSSRSTEATPTRWRTCGPARWWSTIRIVERSGGTGSCDSSSRVAAPCWPSVAPGSRPGRRRRRVPGGRGAPRAPSPGTGRTSSGRWRWSPSPRRTLGGVPYLPQPTDARRAAPSPTPIVEPEPLHLSDVVRRFRTALAASGTEAVASTFGPDGYLRESGGPQFTHRGVNELHSYFHTCFSAGGGIDLQPCAVTDDGARCALEYNCVRWGTRDLPPRAGIVVLDRRRDELLAAARFYDDVEPPEDRRQ